MESTSVATEQPKGYFDPDTGIYFQPQPIRQSTIEALTFFQFKDDAGRVVVWTQGQLEIIDCILNRSDPTGLIKRIQIKASTQYGKSLAVAAGVVIRASIHPEKWAIVAGTVEKARIIMEYVIMLSLNNEIVRTQLDPATPLDKLRMKRSADRLVFKRHGEVRVYSADASKVSETSTALMGFGSQNVIEDESALIPDTLQATVTRMLGGYKDNLLIKIGNPFNRGHFYRSWMNKSEKITWYRIFIDYKRALEEGRYTEQFINEMSEEAMFDILYACKSPTEGSIDSKGWMALLTESEVEAAQVDDDYFVGQLRLGCDVAGGGRNYSTMVLRSDNVAAVAYHEHQPDTMVFGSSIIQMMIKHTIDPRNTSIDAVGIGKGVYDMVVNQEQWNTVRGIQAGREPINKERFANLRAEIFWRLREWVLAGGKLIRNPLWIELTKVKWKVKLSGKSNVITIMSKEDMLREQIDSPDVADSLSFTFADPIPPSLLQREMDTIKENEQVTLDPYAEGSTGFNFGGVYQ